MNIQNNKQVFSKSANFCIQFDSSRTFDQHMKPSMVGCWHGYLSGVRCRFAYGPADATATQYSLSLASVKSRLVNDWSLCPSITTITTICTDITKSTANNTSTSSNWAASSNHFFLFSLQSLLDCNLLAKNMMSSHHCQATTTGIRQTYITNTMLHKPTQLNGRHSMVTCFDIRFCFQ